VVGLELLDFKSLGDFTGVIFVDERFELSQVPEARDTRPLFRQGEFN
jgi:hypothetical protein